MHQVIFSLSLKASMFSTFVLKISHQNIMGGTNTKENRLKFVYIMNFFIDYIVMGFVISPICEINIK